MGILEGVKNQFRSIVQWDKPEQWEIFRRFTDRGDELKNASKLILQPGQGCIFTYEGKIRSVFDQEGSYDLATDNTPFITTIKKVMNAFESEHKVGLWFYRKADIVNIRWGTRIAITYNDPQYGFPVNLRGYGNFSIRISQPAAFFTNIVAGKEHYYADDLQELFLSRIGQPISNYLANAKFSYAEIDSNIENIAKAARDRTQTVFEELGFQMLDFRIEGTSFDDETFRRIAGISDTQAEVKAAQAAGLSYVDYQKMKAMRDAAGNQGAAGAGVGLLAGLNLGGIMGQPTAEPKADIKSKLTTLRNLLDGGLIDEAEFKKKKADILDQM